MTTAEGTPTPRLEATTWRWLVAWGVGVWAAVAVFIRLVGHVLLAPSAPAVVAGFFVAVGPLMALVTYPVYRRFDVPAADRPTAAAAMSVPGLFLDVLLVLGAGLALPNLSRGAVVNFGAVLLFGYAVVLLTGFVPRAGRARSGPGT